MPQYSQYPDQSPQGGSGIMGRLMTFAVIGLIAWGMYMCQVEKNPITGERQHVAITPAEEVRLGLESAPEMSREMGGELPDSDPRTQEVKKIGNYIVSKTSIDQGPWKFQFHLLADSHTVNAFALPGGQIFITDGLYKQLENEAQLAGVLSHEMGHVIQRHSAQQMAKGQFGQLLVIAVAAASSGSSDYSSSQRGAPMIAAVINQMMQLKYSRHDESEADMWGLKLMSEAGYNPHAMVDVMEVLKASGSKSENLDIFQTHPDPDLRIKQINAYLLQHPPADNLTEGNKLEHTSISVPSERFGR